MVNFRLLLMHNVALQLGFRTPAWKWKGADLTTNLQLDIYAGAQAPTPAFFAGPTLLSVYVNVYVCIYMYMYVYMYMYM